MKTKIQKFFYFPEGIRIKASTRNLFAVTLLILLALASAKAQSLKAGITAGVSSSDVKIDRSFSNVMEGKNIYGFEGGVFIRPKLGPLYVKPELLYDYRKGNVNTPSSPERVSSTASFTMHTLEVPVLFGICICPLFIEAGPVYNYVLGVTRQYNDNTVALNKNGLGYRVGAGLDLGPLMLHLHYQGITYQASGDKATFKDPSRLIFGLSLAFGSRWHSRPVKED